MANSVWKRSRLAYGALAVLIFAAAILAVWPLRFDLSLHSLRVRRLFASAVRAQDAVPHREIEGRVHGGLAHRPLRIVRDAERNGEDWRAKLAFDAVSTLASDQDRGDLAPVRAISLLLTGRDSPAIDAFVRLLCRGGEESVAQCVEKSTNAALLSDLACAYDVRAQHQPRPDDALLAAAAAQRAFALDPTSPEAAWNHALAIERLGLLRESRDAWQAYLKVDDASGWANEARARLASLNEPAYGERWTAAADDLEHAWQHGDAKQIEEIALKYPVAVFALIEKDWLGRWAEAVERSDASAAASARAAITAAATGLKRAGDSLTADFVTARSDDGATIAAHGEWVRAHEVLRSSGTSAAIDVLTVASRRLSLSPFRVVAIVEIAGLNRAAGRNAESLALLDGIASSLNSGRWPILAARADWIRGTALTSLGYAGRATNAYLHAMESFRRVGDASQLGMLELLLADNAELAGNLQESWTRYRNAVREVERNGDPQRALVVLDTFARAALRRGHPGFAGLLNDALLSRAHDPASVPYRCHALITRADLLSRLGHSAAARQAAQEARSLWAGIPDATVRQQLETDLLATEAAAITGEARIAALTRAVDVATGRLDLYRRAHVLLQRARAYVQAGATEMARQDLEEALTFIEQERARLEAVQDKIAYFETSRAISEELTELFIRQGKHEKAINVIERVRARLLVDRLSHGGSAPRSLVEIQKALPADTAIIEYWSSASAMFAWVIRRDHLDFVRLGAPRSAVAEAARRLRDAIEDGTGWQTDAEFLQESLVTPLAPSLSEARRIVIVQDETTPDFPYSALFDRGTGTFLIERFQISVAPSATALLLARPLRTLDSAIIVANPITSAGLPVLDVRAELAAALRAIPRAIVLEREQATLSALRNGVATASLVHLATHGFADDISREPMLAFTPERADDDGLMPASEAERLPIRRGALVVLAACRTARGKNSSEGTLNLARAFLSAGAGTVVAATGDVADTDSSAIVREYYGQIANGADTVTAFHLAQLHELRTHRDAHPQRWAAYQVYGGGE